MPREQALAFIARVQNEPELQNTVAGIKGKGVLDRLVELGAAHGFAFTAEEYREAVVQLSEGELSDKALDDVRRELGML